MSASPGSIPDSPAERADSPQPSRSALRPPFSRTPAGLNVANGLPTFPYPSTNFVVAAGSVSYHPTSRRVLLISNTTSRGKNYFLPRGRKQIGESLDACALREALEQGGYPVRALPTYSGTMQPAAQPHQDGAKDAEAFWITLSPLSRTRMYLSHYFIAEVIGINPSRDTDYGRRFVGYHGQNYDSELVPVEDAVRLLSSGAVSMTHGVPTWTTSGAAIVWEEVGDSEHLEACLVVRGWQLVLEAVSRD